MTAIIKLHCQQITCVWYYQYSRDYLTNGRQTFCLEKKYFATSLVRSVSMKDPSLFVLCNLVKIANAPFLHQTHMRTNAHAITDER